MSAAPDHSQILSLAGQLLGGAITAASPVSGGANNVILRLEGERGPVAAKVYPPQLQDNRDRLGQEYAALSFLAEHDIASVPAPLACDPEHHLALYQWIEGEAINDFDQADVDALSGFLVKLQTLRTAAGAAELSNASANCFSIDGAIQQLQDRMARIEACAKDHPELDNYLKQSLVPATKRTIAAVREQCAGEGVNTAAVLASEHRALSPSDFGFHNAKRRSDGEIMFLDFEYFGWDDPVKMVADVMLHPGMNLPDALSEHFRNSVSPAFSADETFPFRLETLYPVYGLIWCIILLNEFLPEAWDRRHAAGHKDSERARAAQLKKSEMLLERLSV